jgi:hypothetical protein
MKIGLKGLYMGKAHRLDGSSRVLFPWTDNLILDAGLNRIGTGGIFGRAMYGGSNAAPDAGQTGLITLLAETAVQQETTSGTDLVNNYCYVRYTYRFAQATSNVNVNEIGIGWAANTCFSRALTVDGVGAPSTVTIEAGEFFDLTYELRIYWPTTDVVGSITLNNINYDFTARAANVANWALPLANYMPTDGSNIFTGGMTASWYNGGDVAGLGAITAGPNGSFFANNTMNFLSGYSNNSYLRVVRAFRGITGPQQTISGAVFSLGALGIYKAAFNPVIPKDNTNNLNLDMTLVWARKTI